MPNRRRFSSELAKTLALASPIVAGQVGQMSMGLVDTLMVGHVGTNSLAAAAFANSLMSVAFVFGIGVLTSVGVLASRAHGAGMDRHKQVTAMGGLRGLADVRVPMIFAFTYYWLCAIPIGYLAAFVFKAGAIGIWYGLATGLFIAAITLTTRFCLLTGTAQVGRSSA